MKQESPSPAAHLVRFGVAASRGAYRTFLRHVWMETDLAQDLERAESATREFEKALERPDTQFPLGTQPWTGVLARALRRVARLFADEGLANRFGSTKSGAPISPVLNAFAPLCADMDSELEASGFEILLGESESALRSRLAAYLPTGPVLPDLGAPRVWLPDLFAGMMHASIWREIVAEPSTLRIAATTAACFLEGLIKEINPVGAFPTVTMMEQAILIFAPKAVDYGLGQVAWITDPEAASELEEKALPYLRAAFSRETPLTPVVAPVVVPPVPMLGRGVPPKSKPPLPPVEEIPILRAIPKTGDPGPSLGPMFPHDDDDEMPPPSANKLRWLIGAVGIVLVVATIISIFGDGGVGSGPELAGVDAAVTSVNDPVHKGPEKMIVSAIAPLPEPEQVTAAPFGAVRLFEQAQFFIEAAARAKRSGDNRQAAEDMSRAMLILKQDFAEQRWQDERYLRLRADLRVQLGLLELSAEQIAAIEGILGAREAVKATTDEKADLAKVAATFQRGDEELERGRPKAAAEAYELALRTGLAILGEKHATDRTYQQYLSKYIDFLISENMEPDEMHLRIGLVKMGKKPKPLPDKKAQPELEGLGLPKL